MVTTPSGRPDEAWPLVNVLGGYGARLARVRIALHRRAARCRDPRSAIRDPMDPRTLVGDVFLAVGVESAIEGVEFAAAVGGLVVIQDEVARVVACSSLTEYADPVRVAVILERRVPDHVRGLYERWGVYAHLATSDKPLFVPPHTDSQVQRPYGRRCTGRERSPGIDLGRKHDPAQRCAEHRVGGRCLSARPCTGFCRAMTSARRIPGCVPSGAHSPCDLVVSAGIGRRHAGRAARARRGARHELRRDIARMAGSPGRPRRRRPPRGGASQHDPIPPPQDHRIDAAGPDGPSAAARNAD